MRKRYEPRDSRNVPAQSIDFTEKCTFALCLTKTVTLTYALWLERERAS